MNKILLLIVFIVNLLHTSPYAQTCEITEVNAMPLACVGNNFWVTIDLEVNNPASPGFTLAGNGVIYGTYLYSDLPVSVGPLLGDDESTYEFIAWDVENAECQNFTTMPAANCGPICSISNFVMDYITCVSNQGALVEFTFTATNPAGPAFDLLNEEGEEIGSWLYSSLPVTLPFFEVNGAAPIIVTVCDQIDDECCETFTLEAFDCNPNNCEIFSINPEPQCTGNNFVVHLDFGYDNPPSDSFKVSGNNLNYGTFGYNELPVTLGPLNGNTGINWVFNIEDSESPACNGIGLLGVYNCPPPCDILALEAMALECNGNEAYVLEVGLDIEGEGDLGFAIFSETHYYGSYSYDDVPVTIPTYESTEDPVDIVSVCDNENLSCCATLLFEGLNCMGCLIYNLTATPLPCNDEGQVFVEINFDYQNVSTEGFEVTGDMENYGEFSYEDLPVQVGPFNGDGSQFFEFVVTDLLDPSCLEGVELGFIDCEDICELTNLVVETGDCSGNNTYVATIDFDYQGVAGIGFDLFINGDLYESYQYEDLPLTIEEFPSNGTGLDTLTVCENDNDQCCATLAFEAPDCACSLFDLTAQLIGCTSDSTFTIAVEFFTENFPGNSVDVFLDGVFIGFYNAENLPITVELPEGDGSSLLTVCANDLNNCCDEIVVELIQCENPECQIWDLIAETGDCNSDSTYVLDIVFNYDNLPTDSIVVTANNQFIGQYLIQPDFNRIENFPVLDGDTTMIQVCAVGAPDCCDTYSFVTPDCSLFGQCNIWDLVAEAGDCTSDSTYNLHIQYQYQNLPSDSVVITANGNELGQFAATEDVFIVENVAVYDTANTLITVCAAGAPDCCDSFEFATPDCSLFGQCNIWDLVADIDGCTSDSTFNMHILYNYQNLPSDSVIITANGIELGQFHATDDAFLLENVPVFDTGITELSVCALGAPDCCDVVEFETPDCPVGDECNIWDLIAEIGDCTSDTTYNLYIDFNYMNLPTDSVIITANGNEIGQFQATPEAILLENFPVYDAEHTVVTVCAVGAPDCCDVYEFATPNCEGGGTCNIYDLVADPGTCSSDSTYTLFIHYFAINLPVDSVIITANEETVGQYAHNPDGINIENFPASNISPTVITVCAVSAPDCCDTFEFETPDCGQGFVCNIYDLFAETGDCTSDSTYVLDVVFESNHLPTDSVLIYANDELVGQYYNNPDFIHIENFPHLDGEQTTVTVCALGAPDCCDSYTFETPFCTDTCVIYDVSVNVFDCNSDSTFAVVVHFDYQNIPGSGFDIYAGDQYLGFFTFDQVPAEIPHFPSNETGQYVVTICESDGMECCTSFEFEGPACGIGGCEIFNLEYTLTECDSAGNFYFILDFDFQNVGDQGFNVVGNGNEYGNFSYDNVPVQIGPFPTDDTVYEFLVFDAAHPDCSDAIEPGMVECFVSTEPIDPEQFFQVFNNGTLPGVLARKDILLSLYNGNGKLIVDQLAVSADEMYEMHKQPSGLYIGTVMYGDHIWPIKLIKAGN